MKASTYLISLTAAMLVFASGTSVAQTQRGGQQQGGQQGGQQQGAQQQQQQRQAERAMSQDRVMDQERLQTRERDRTQDREQAQDRTHAAAGPAEGIYGGNLMTVQERNQYRAELDGLQDEQQRKEYEARHREQMQLRAKERGIEPEVTTD
jgi:hypothetical protein